MICSLGSVGADGFMGFDNDLTGSEVIDGGTKDPVAQSVRDELGRLRGRFCPDGVVEFRVCRFGAGKNGRKALQAIADITRANLTAPHATTQRLLRPRPIPTPSLTPHP